MELNFRWFLGRDLRQLTDAELREAFMVLGERERKSRPSQQAWSNILHEWHRRNYPMMLVMDDGRKFEV